MVIENTKLLFKLYYNPLAAMSGLIDKGNWFYGVILATAVALLFSFSVTSHIHEAFEAVPLAPQKMRLPQSQRASYQMQAQAQPQTPDDDDDEQTYSVPRPQRLPLPLIGNSGWWVFSFRAISLITIALSLAVLYVPGTILVLALLERIGSFTIALRRDYGAMLSCALMAWAASHLPFALAGLAIEPLQLNANVALLLWALSNLYFGALMICALRTVCGASLSNAAITIGISWVTFALDSVVFSIATFSPFMTIIWIAPLALGALAGMRAAHAQRQSFLRHLEACTINEHDAEAQYQLGVIYQQRRQDAEALKHFKRAVEIDPKEPDANFQLGVVDRKEGRLQAALNHFSIVLAQDDKYRQSEVWREIGATYLAAEMFEEAKAALGKYHERRPYDPEGLYHFAETLSKMGEADRAGELYRQCIEAVKTMPYYRRKEVSKWGKLAQGKL